MICSAISRVSSFEADDDTDDSVGTGQEKKHDYALLCHSDTVGSRMKAEWGKSYSKGDLSSQKWNCAVLSLSTSCDEPSVLNEELQQFDLNVGFCAIDLGGDNAP